MLYRVHQLIQALIPRIRPAELQWAFSILPQPAIQLFLRQTLPEQRHALDVAYDLWSSYPQNTNLIVAALLHDCGKIKSPLNILERIYIVLIQMAPRSLWNFLLRSRPFFSSPLRTAQFHPIWGADLARCAGLNHEIVDLIQYHHTPKTPEGLLLYQADNRH